MYSQNYSVVIFPTLPQQCANGESVAFVPPPSLAKADTPIVFGGAKTALNFPPVFLL